MNDLMKVSLVGVISGLVVVIAGNWGGVSSTVSPVHMSAAAAVPEVAALRLDFGPKLTASSCGGIGSPIVNVTEGIKNDADSGEAGNYWGFDMFQRTIQVWRTSTDGTYCAVVRYMGNFNGVSGQTSPGNTAPLTGNERGPVQGGYSATITGTPLAVALWSMQGNVGTYDYQCDLSGNCPGAVSWVTQYFNGDYSFTYNWWGWIYRAGGNKTWVNSSEGNLGDVI